MGERNDAVCRSFKSRRAKCFALHDLALKRKYD